MTFQTVFKNEKEFEEFKTWTLGLLHDENTKDLCITFIKKDGSERAMHCTLINIPVTKRVIGKESNPSSQNSGSACRVFDLDKGEWRSFRWDSVIKVSFSL
jgi:hypothetical protein